MSKAKAQTLWSGFDKAKPASDMAIRVYWEFGKIVRIERVAKRKKERP